jgi:c-di-GMP-related signal transduction protein
MNTHLENRQQLLTELLDNSAQIDHLLSELKYAPKDEQKGYSQQLEQLRAKQKETTQILQMYDQTSVNSWENIGDGG